MCHNQGTANDRFSIFNFKFLKRINQYKAPERVILYVVAFDKRQLANKQ